MFGGSDEVGLGALCLAALCTHYGVEYDTFYAMGFKANWFVNVWWVEDNSTTDEFDRPTNAFASMMLDGHQSTGLLINTRGSCSSSVLGSTFGSSNDECVGDEGAPPGRRPSRQSKSDRMTHKNTDMRDEGSIEECEAFPLKRKDCFFVLLLGTISIESWWKRWECS